MITRLRLLATTSVLGWLVAVPILVTALLDPFVSFRNWPSDFLRGSGAGSSQLARVEPGDGAASAVRRPRAPSPERAASPGVPGEPLGATTPGPAARPAPGRRDRREGSEQRGSRRSPGGDPPGGAAPGPRAPAGSTSDPAAALPASAPPAAEDPAEPVRPPSGDDSDGGSHEPKRGGKDARGQDKRGGKDAGPAPGRRATDQPAPGREDAKHDGKHDPGQAPAAPPGQAGAPDAEKHPSKDENRKKDGPPGGKSGKGGPGAG